MPTAIGQMPGDDANLCGYAISSTGTKGSSESGNPLGKYEKNTFFGISMLNYQFLLANMEIVWDKKL